MHKLLYKDIYSEGVINKCGPYCVPEVFNEPIVVCLHKLIFCSTIVHFGHSVVHQVLVYVYVLPTRRTSKHCAKHSSILVCFKSLYFDYLISHHSNQDVSDFLTEFPNDSAFYLRSVQSRKPELELFELPTYLNDSLKRITIIDADNFRENIQALQTELRGISESEQSVIIFLIEFERGGTDKQEQNAEQLKHEFLQ